MNKYISALLVLLFSVLAYMALSRSNDDNLFTSATAVIALGMSLFNFYFQHFRSLHKLSCTLISASYDGDSIQAYYTFENIGTFEELIIGGTFVFPEKDTGKFSYMSTRNEDDFMPEMMEPYILKPKEIILKHFSLKVSADQLSKHLGKNSGDEFEQVIDIKIDLINPKTRCKAAKLVKCAKLKSTKKYIHMGKMYFRQTELLDGELLRI
jgi:hypothetical protein